MIFRKVVHDNILSNMRTRSLYYTHICLHICIYLQHTLPISQTRYHLSWVFLIPLSIRLIFRKVVHNIILGNMRTQSHYCTHICIHICTYLQHVLPISQIQYHLSWVFPIPLSIILFYANNLPLGSEGTNLQVMTSIKFHIKYQSY